MVSDLIWDVVIIDATGKPADCSLRLRAELLRRDLRVKLDIVQPASESAAPESVLSDAKRTAYCVVLATKPDGTAYAAIPAQRRFGQLPSTAKLEDIEVGRIQGRQFRVLLPKGGALLYLQGPPDTSAAQERFQGMSEATEGAGFDVKVLSGQWTEASAEKAIQGWLRLRTSEGAAPQLVCSQNDAMAVGARRVLLAHGPEWASVPFTGCDGLPGGGQKLVRERVLAATVVTPSNGGPAVDLVAAALETGEPSPAQLVLAPRSFPPEAELTRGRGA